MISFLRAQLFKAGPKPFTRGFTLIEMSIVLVVIGLIIGGILKGQEIIDSAREKSVIDDAGKITAATFTFYDRYQTWPGDYARASTRINATLPDGDGSGVIDDRRTTNNNTRGPRGDWRHGSNMTNNQRQEYQTAWLHLSLAGMLDGIDTNVATVTNETFPSGPHPSMHYEIGHSSGNLRGGPRDLPFGIYIRYSLWDDNGNPRQNGGLTPAQAQRIDRKLDDGIPYQDTNANPSYRATVFATNGQDYGNQDCGSNGNVYRGPDFTEKACTLFFKVRD